MYIHDHALIVLRRYDLRDSVRLGRGVRQGCGLSPQLWLAFTVLFFDKVSYLPSNAVSGFADDFHIQWSIHSARDMHNACSHIPRVIQDLNSLGMNVSADKTVALLALAGADAPKLMKTYTERTPKGRFLKIAHPTHPVQLPLKQQHTYLGVIISYKSFERYTLQHRQQLSWQAFHRLRKFLTNEKLPLKKRVQLWQSCVFTIMSYGLAATGLDPSWATKLRGAVMRQLRITTRSLGHLTHETNDSLLHRLGLLDPVQHVQRMCHNRIATCRQFVHHLQPARVHQWWDILSSTFTQLAQGHPSADAPATVTEVTQVLRIRCSCQICGQQFPSLHALRVHLGKQHPEAQPQRRERNPTIKNKRNDSFRVHSLDGLPTCKHCRKSFHGWPAFMGHFSQQACPVLHGQQHCTHTTEASPPGLQANQHQCQNSSTTVPELAQASQALPISQPAPGEVAADLVDFDMPPTFHRPALQMLAKQRDLQGLARAVQNIGRLQYCPECNQKLTHPKYLTRHACKMHDAVKELQPAVEQWLTARTQIGQPCRWCLLPYATRPANHAKACAVLWTCGHLLARHSDLQDQSQPSIQDVFGTARRAASGGGSGAGTVLSLHAALPGGHSNLDGAIDEGRGDGKSLGHGAGRKAQTQLPEPSRSPDARAGDTAAGNSAKVPQSRGQRRQQGRGQPQPEHSRGSRSSRDSGGRDGHPPEAGGGEQDRTSGTQRKRTLAGAPMANQTGSSAPAPAGGAEPELQGPATGRLELGTPAVPVAQPLRQKGRLPAQRGQREGSGPPKGNQGAQEHHQGHGQAYPADRGSSSRGHVGQGIFPIPSDGGQRQRMERDQAIVDRGNRLRETSPEEITQPLRCVLLHAFLTALQSQVTAIETNSQLLQQAKDRGLMQDESYCYLRWDHQERRHLPAPQQPLEHQTLQQCIQLMLRLIVFPNTVGNFHPVRKMTAGLSSEVLPFALVIQNRNQEAQQLYQCCQRLSRNSSLHLVGATMRPAKLGRSPAAVALDKMLQDL